MGMMSLSTLLKSSGTEPFSIAPQPATVIGGPCGQTPQQFVLQIGEIGMGRTLAKPSRGVAGLNHQKLNKIIKFHGGIKILTSTSMMAMSRLSVRLS
jgi:hypothetical protein